jgi:hypothetical protein
VKRNGTHLEADVLLGPSHAAISNLVLINHSLINVLEGWQLERYKRCLCSCGWIGS